MSSQARPRARSSTRVVTQSPASAGTAPTMRTTRDTDGTAAFTARSLASWAASSTNTARARQSATMYSHSRGVFDW